MRKRILDEEVNDSLEERKKVCMFKKRKKRMQMKRMICLQVNVKMDSMRMYYESTCI